MAKPGGTSTEGRRGGDAGRFGKEVASDSSLAKSEKNTRADAENAIRSFLGKAVSGGVMANKNESMPSFSESVIKAAAQDVWRTAHIDTRDKGSILSISEMRNIVSIHIDREMNRFDKFIKTTEDKIRTSYFKTYNPTTTHEKSLAERIVKHTAIEAAKHLYSSSTFEKGNVKYNVRAAISSVREALKTQN